MKDDIKKWIEKDGEQFLRKISLKEGQTVLDFGCGEGHYTIPAAEVVGKKGKVYALDKDIVRLSGLKKLARLRSIENIETLSWNLLNLVKDSSVDVVLCYDVLHYQDRKKRDTIYSEIHRVLNSKGILSVYPKHHKQDYPLDHWADMDLEDIIKEIKETGFILKDKFLESLLHDEHFNKGHILNFEKI